MFNSSGKGDGYMNTWEDFKTSDDIVSLIVKQSIKTPNAIAYRSQEGCISYKDLVQAVEVYASKLYHDGVRENDIVIIGVDRSIKMMICILSVMKIHAVYLPLDTNYPKERLGYIAQDSKAKWAIADDIKDVFEEFDIINLQYNEAEKTENWYGEKIEVSKTENHMAYVIYTSGTTGNPKGVMVSNCSLINFLISMKRILNIQETDNILALTTICFDISMLELFLPVVCGATCTIANKVDLLDAIEIQRYIENVHITLIQATPTFWEILLNNKWTGNDKVKILCGGEKMSSQLAKKLLPICKELWNMYGPTETTIWSSVERVKEPSQIFIGQPIDRTTLYVVDTEENRVLESGIGELFIGGAGVAIGYLNKKEITEEKFVSGVNLIESDKLLYRTGDLVRKYPDGNIEYLERIDQQVKYRGYRIECGEIEKRLEEVDAIEKAVVDVIQDEQVKELTAFLIISNQSLQKREIIAYVKSYLPEYMIPEKYIILKEIPMTLNQKVQRNVLMHYKTLDYEVLTDKEQKKLEKTGHAVDSIVFEMIAQIIGYQQIEFSDRIRYLGLNSIKLSILCGKLLEAGYRVNMREILLCDRVEDLVNLTHRKEKVQKEGLCKNEASENAVILYPSYKNKIEEKTSANYCEKLTIEKVYPLTHTQIRMLCNHYFYKGTYAFNQCITYSVSGDLDLDLCQQIIDNLAIQIDILRSVYSLQGMKMPVRAVLDKVENKLRYIDITQDRANTVDSIIETEKSRSYELNCAVPIVISIVKIAENKYQFIWAFHHIMFDGYSANNVIKKFFVQYNQQKTQISTGETELQENCCYAEWLSNADFTHAKTFWDEYLSGYEFDKLKTRLGDSKEIERNLEYAMSIYERNYHIDESVIRTFSNNVWNYGMSFNTCTSFLWAIILACRQNVDDVLFGMVFSGRNSCPAEYIETDDMMINTVLIRVKLDMEKSFIDNLEAYKENLYNVFIYEYMPIEEMNIQNVNQNTLLDNVLIFSDYEEQREDIFSIANKVNLDIADWQSYDVLNCKLGIFILRENGLVIKVLANSEVYVPDEVDKILTQFGDIISVISNSFTMPMKEIINMLK